ncbi:hypothetical protein [Bacillus sp. AFS041924]|uniref:hypothetical protein n=1 Tax=Bacillus sp. AFS041924 TaxID=2033503 RepID=UPI000C032E55|nr:hypothetical protein [Bacillus sp. AFS041924]PGS49112.1 hypothetical protein COC46_15740 [Bacillus sp. AFS041924]
MTMKTSGKVFLIVIIALTIPFLKYTKFGDLIALLVLIGISIFNKKIRQGIIKAWFEKRGVLICLFILLFVLAPFSFWILVTLIN